jgi:SAM-dependent methyltransferase
MQDEQFYQSKLDNETNEMKQVGWDNTNKAVDRYIMAAKLIEIMADKGSLVVDYGCGLGVLSDYLQEYFYKGIDRLPAMVEGAKNRAGIDVQLGTAKDIDHADVLVNLGAWTLKNGMNDLDYEEMVMSELEIISGKCDIAVINGFHLGADYYDEKLYYHDIGKLISWCTHHGYDWNVYNFERWEFFIVITF